VETRVLIHAIELQDEKHSVIIEEERPRLYRSTLTQQTIDSNRIYTLGKADGITNAYKIKYGKSEGINNCIVFASGSPTSLHPRSGILRDDQCIFAEGYFLVVLTLPDLNLAWHTKVDSAACFAVYHIPQYDGYLSHGELSIAFVSYTGEIKWSNTGKDIFTNGITLSSQSIEVIDFQDNKYQFDLRTGKRLSEKSDQFLI